MRCSCRVLIPSRDEAFRQIFIEPNPLVALSGARVLGFVLRDGCMGESGSVHTLDAFRDVVGRLLRHRIYLMSLAQQYGVPGRAQLVAEDQAPPSHYTATAISHCLTYISYTLVGKTYSSSRSLFSASRSPKKYPPRPSNCRIFLCHLHKLLR